MIIHKLFKPCVLAFLFSFVFTASLQAQDPAAIDAALDEIVATSNSIQTTAAQTMGDANYVRSHLNNGNNGNGNNQVNNRLGEIQDAIVLMATDVSAMSAAAAFVGNPILISVSDGAISNLTDVATIFGSILLRIESGELPTADLDALVDDINAMKLASSCIRREIQTIRSGL